MKWIETKVVFDCSDKQLAVELISDAFDAVGVRGVVVEDPDEEPAEGWGDGPVFRPEHHSVIGYFPEGDKTPGRCRLLEEKLSGLEKSSGVQSRVAYRDIDEQDWAESWKAFFWPEKISPAMVIKPTWREYDAYKGEIVIEIDPGMAFGTGTHPTTRLCINMMETHLENGASVLDIGTGSGILLVAAAKLGGGRLYGIDTDGIAVDIARKNLQLNGVGESVFSLRTGTLSELAGNPFDLIVANILSEVIVELLVDIPRVLKKNGTFICSGIIEKNKGKVCQAMEERGFHIFDERLRESWVALAGRLKGRQPSDATP